MTRHADTAARPTIYAEVTGAGCVVNGQGGTLTGIHRAPGQADIGFVRLDGSIYDGVNGPRAHHAPALVGVMLAVYLGARAGERGERREVVTSVVITRDDFDRLTGLNEVRADLGWPG